MSSGDELARMLAEHDDWLTVERGLAPNSLAAYRRDLRRYAAFLRARGDTDPAHIGEDAVHAYVRHLESLVDDDGRRVLAPASVARGVVAVRSFHRFCAAKDWSTTTPARMSARRACRKGSRRRLTRPMWSSCSPR